MHRRTMALRPARDRRHHPGHIFVREPPHQHVGRADRPDAPLTRSSGDRRTEAKAAALARERDLDPFSYWTTAPVRCIGLHAK